MLLTRPPLKAVASYRLPFDLHVLGMPPAFNLSQDQTLQFNTKLSNITLRKASPPFLSRINFQEKQLPRSALAYLSARKPPPQQPIHPLKELGHPLALLLYRLVFCHPDGSKTAIIAGKYFMARCFLEFFTNSMNLKKSSVTIKLILFIRIYF